MASGATPKWAAICSRLSPDWERYSRPGGGVFVGCPRGVKDGEGLMTVAEAVGDGSRVAEAVGLGEAVTVGLALGVGLGVRNAP
jgi:hypothetical protein